MSTRSSKDSIPTSSLPNQQTPVLEDAYHKAKIDLNLAKKYSKRLFSKLKTTQQQIEFYSHESQLAFSNLQSLASSMSKDIFTDLLTNTTPSSTTLEICDKILLILNQPTRSFSDFQSQLKNFSQFKALIIKAEGQTLKEGVINDLLPVWKNQTTIQAKVFKSSKGTAWLAKWIGFVVEYTLKNETVGAAKRKLIDLELKIKSQLRVIKEIGSVLERYEREKQDDEKDIREEMSGKLMMLNWKNNHRASNSIGTFSGALNIIQGFEYADQEINQGIIYEGANETIGCCRSKFFCF